jgi:hypothetical protein
MIRGLIGLLVSVTSLIIVLSYELYWFYGELIGKVFVFFFFFFFVFFQQKKKGVLGFVEYAIDPLRP